MKLFLYHFEIRGLFNMRIINREIGYAIKALCFMIKEKDKVVTTGHLANCIKISRPFLRKILQQLNIAGILNSYKGKGGGFQLAMEPDQIILIDLVKIFQGPVQVCSCYNKGQECPLIKDCPVRHEIENLEKKFISELSKISLRGFVGEADKIYY